jgi:hypothetical protein
MIRLIRTLGTLAVATALLAIPVGTGQGAALAQASCAGTTDHVHGNFDAAVPSTTNGSGNFDCIDGIGNSGPAVAEIQRSLNHCYGQNLMVDSQYGQQTSNAMKVAQRRLGLPVSEQDGVYGPITRHAGFLFWGVAIQPPHSICGTAGF